MVGDRHNLEQTDSTVVFIELQAGKPLPDGTVLRIAANGSKAFSVSTKEAATTVLRNLLKIDAILINYPDLDIVRDLRRLHPSAASILITDQPIEQYSLLLNGEDNMLLDHVIANRYPSAWTINECRITLQKLLRRDVFGIEKYLRPGTVTRGGPVTGSSCRAVYNRDIQKFAEEFKFNLHQSKTAYGICEELLMNAVYDAPIAGGVRKHSDTNRTVAIELEPSEQGWLSYGCDDNVLAIGVSDPFGSMDRSVFFKYLTKVRFRNDSNTLIDKKPGGAGLGLLKILFGAHSLICNVEKGKKTEMIALIDSKLQVRDFSRMTRSISFFEASGN